MKILFKSYTWVTEFIVCFFNGLVNFRNNEIWYRYFFYLSALMMSLYVSLESFDILYHCYMYRDINYSYTVFFCDKCYYTFNIDLISGGLIFLTGTVIFICLVYVWNKPDRIVWTSYLIVTIFLIIAAFVVIDLLYFFIIFELLIFPIYKIILGWGSPGDLKLTASRSFVMYTVFGSILLLFVIVNLYLTVYTTNLSVIFHYRELLPEYLLVVIFIAFATKVPTFPFYHWLTLAHVEASTVGSVILAALILKLGGYGFIRFLIPLFSSSTYFNTYYSIALFLFVISSVFASLCAITQSDIKRIIAYSSIEHINLGIAGLAFGGTVASTGSYVIIIAHGWVSAGLFFAVGLIYDYTHQRDLLYYRGLALVNGWWSIMFGLLLIVNIGFPLTLNFLAEIQILISIFGSNIWILLFLFIIIMSNIVYTVKLGSILWGLPYKYLMLTKWNSWGYCSTVWFLLGIPLLLVVLFALPVSYLRVSELVSDNLLIIGVSW